jgi:methionyl-tRNA formyltransferase
MTRALFFGTPEFSVPSLEALAEIATVVGVVCQPDRPASRGLKLTTPPVKERALAMGIPVVQPTKLRTGEFAAWVRAEDADIALVIAYGRILPQDVLDAPRLGCVNLHASILPKYRGAAPITWAIVRGEPETGITLMRMDAGMDTGDMLEVLKTPIGEEETAAELGARLSQLAARVVRESLPRFIRGELTARPQDPTQATLAPLLQKEMGRIDWTQPAPRVHDHVRGMNPWPMAFSHQEGQAHRPAGLPDGSTPTGGVGPPVPPTSKRVIVHRTKVVEGALARVAKAGEVVIADKSRVVVACGSGLIELMRVQLEGKKAVTGAEWFLGRGVREGDVLGVELA